MEATSYCVDFGTAVNRHLGLHYCAGNVRTYRGVAEEGKNGCVSSVMIVSVSSTWSCSAQPQLLSNLGNDGNPGGANKQIQ
jgi:hypothetical protein